MPVKKSYEEINQKIREGRAVVVSAEEVLEIVKEKGVKESAKYVDVVTTATFGPMCSTGCFLNFGHSDPPIRMSRAWLNDVPAYCGLAAVDAYIGATEPSESRGIQYGGAHVICDLIEGKKIRLKALSPGTDCYPRKEIDTYITREDINEAYLFNPRNCYQNYAAATNTSDKPLYTYMGILQPRMGNINYSTSGQLSPLINDPYYRTIGIGTRIFLAGTRGYVAWQGTQFNPDRQRNHKGVPVSPSATLAVIGDLKEMNTRFIRPAVFEGYGVSMFVGLGIPIPILDEDMMECVSIEDRDIYTDIVDYSVPRRSRPVLGRVSYEQLKRGWVELQGKKVKTAPLSSLYKAREIAEQLKRWILEGSFYLQQPVQPLPSKVKFKTLEITSGKELDI